MNRKHTGNKNASGCDKYVHYCFKAENSSEKEKNQAVCTGGSSNSDCDHCGAGRYQFDA